MALPPPKPVGNDAPEAAESSRYLGDEEPNVSPEEQAEYDMFMNNALTLLYAEGEDGGEVRPEVLEALRIEPNENGEGGNPLILALAQSAVTVVSQLDDSARQAGKPVSDDVLYHGGLAVVEELAEIAEAAKINDYSEEDVTGAFMQALDMYRDKAIADGRTTKETLSGQFDEINRAEDEGRLGEILPGLGNSAMGEPPVQVRQE